MARYESAEASLKDTKDKLEEQQRKAAEQARRDKERLDAAAKKGASEVARVKAKLEAEKKAREKAEKQAAAAMGSLAEIAKVKEEKRGVVITMSGAVLFATGKYTLLPTAQSKLADVAKALKDQSFNNTLVEGTPTRGAAPPPTRRSRCVALRRCGARSSPRGSRPTRSRRQGAARVDPSPTTRRLRAAPTTAASRSSSRPTDPLPRAWPASSWGLALGRRLFPRCATPGGRLLGSCAVAARKRTTSA